MNEEKYNIDYSCGCSHEIEFKNNSHHPTGIQRQCEIHKLKDKTEL